MIVQACLNGSRAADYHPEVPRTPDQVARDGAACLRAGAAELHLHPRGIEGRESLDPAVQAATVRAVRAACPGTAFGVSTGGWIEGDALRTLACIAGWTELPDYASVNLSEPHAPAVIGLLRARGIGVEAGLATVADAERLLSLGLGIGATRILVEVGQEEAHAALEGAEAILDVLRRAELRRPILLHGQDAALWPVISLAFARHLSTRVGLEDGALMPNGERCDGNSALVAAALVLRRTGEAGDAQESSCAGVRTT